MTTSIDSIHTKVTSQLRQRRFEFFAQLLHGVQRPFKVLDCGGTVDFWQANGADLLRQNCEITIVNLFECSEVPENFRWFIGDVRDLSRFGNKEFDVVFSNAVINLMPSWEDQVRMSSEVKRVGKRYFVQSPNRFFPVDWRTLVPFFHLLSPQVQAWCFRHFKVGVYSRVPDPEKAFHLATRVRDLSVTQMQVLFPGSKLFRERYCGFTKSIAAYWGW
jgi:hypothetical protein